MTTDRRKFIASVAGLAAVPEAKAAEAKAESYVKTLTVSKELMDDACGFDGVPFGQVVLKVEGAPYDEDVHP